VIYRDATLDYKTENEQQVQFELYNKTRYISPREGNCILTSWRGGKTLKIYIN